MWWTIAIVIVLSYLIGAIPLQYLLGRLKGLDLRNEYDLHISLMQKAGPLFGFTGALGDFLKGVVVILIAHTLNFVPLYVALTGLAVVIGQMWPVFAKFNGEKGNSTGVGMAIALAPRSLLIFAVPMAIGALIRTVPRWRQKGQDVRERMKLGGPPSNSLPIGMAIGLALIPVSTTALFGSWFKQPAEVSWVCFALFILIMIRRATAGIKEDFKTGENKLSIILNRLLLDRGFVDIRKSRQMMSEEPVKNA